MQSDSDNTYQTDAFVKVKGQKYAYRIDPLSFKDKGSFVSFTRVKQDGSQEQFSMVSKDTIEYVQGLGDSDEQQPLI